MSGDVCRTCGRPIEQDARGDWLDDFPRDPGTCPTAASLNHSPAATPEEREKALRVARLLNPNRPHLPHE